MRESIKSITTVTMCFANYRFPPKIAYSVVTDFAKFLGKSTSKPFLTARW